VGTSSRARVYSCDIGKEVQGGGWGEKGCIYEETEIGKEVQVLGRGEEMWK
jgi:hypothetical protein